jgi:hypothetical protein
MVSDSLSAAERKGEDLRGGCKMEMSTRERERFERRFSAHDSSSGPSHIQMPASPANP